MSLHEFASDFLTFLERREENLLHWGFHDISHSESELKDALEIEASDNLKQRWNDLSNSGTSFKNLLRKMKQSNLLYELPEKRGEYRSRLAETLRLLANLRQRFGPDDWSTAPRLVSDIKIHLRDREYPKRNIPAKEIWEKNLRGLCSRETTEFVEQCFLSISQDRAGNAFHFSGFQNRSFAKIFSEYSSNNPTASVVCAGTGSGKTKAFYVPGLLRVAEEVFLNDKPFVKVIAVYPRNVLLADQLKEAIAEALKINSLLKEKGKRPITFGALLGSTPRKKWFDPIAPGQTPKKWHWETRDGGHVIPYLSSPIDEESDLVWKKTDRENQNNSLYRSGQTVPDIPDGILKITREELIKSPPDILFLSLEMLNRELSNPEWNECFGIYKGKLSPRLFLLDEVHTHEGISGANAAWVLRRWKNLIKKTGGIFPHFVGLSATLMEATEHMGRVVGVLPDNVTEFSPREKEMEKEGQEYNLAIKGDPSSGTALLSTSIQVGMLLARSLTPRNHQPSSDIDGQKLFLRKVFGFTDNLDSLNRWFANMEDAELRKRLAQWRAAPIHNPDPTIFQRKRNEGQLWELPERIGYRLDNPLDLSRCSSQDPGANSGSDMIIATASLEVGFDDPEVGIILHHKAPTSMSSFIQRKGRAGRTRGSRPWTVIVLSDYGRDRWAFQTTERLFNPVVDRISLPISNPYILRVQLAAFLIDWLGQRIRSGPAFSFLSRPDSYKKKAQEKAIAILNDFLEQGTEWSLFQKDATAFIMYGIFNKKRESDKERAENIVNEIFWEEPRALILKVLPALLRKLEVNWHQAGVLNELEDQDCRRPIPQSIPQATFQDLDLSEALIELEDYRGRAKENELLSISQFFRETCVGHVSKRFSINDREEGFWHEKSLDLEHGLNTLEIDSLYTGKIPLKQCDGVRIFRPAKARVVHIDRERVIESSSSSWNWQLDVLLSKRDNTETLPLRSSKPWDKIIKRFDAHLHVNGSWIEIIRYAQSCNFETRIPKQEPKLGRVELKDSQGSEEAIGFQINADGFLIEINQSHLEEDPAIDDKLHSQLKFQYFFDQLKTNENLQNHLNIFRADWVAQISIAMLSCTAIRNRVSLKEAQEQLKGSRAQAAEAVLETIFQIRGVRADGETEDSKLKESLMELWENPLIVQEIERVEPCLWQSVDNEFIQWLRTRHVATLAQAFRTASHKIAEQVGEGDLLVDVFKTENKHFILITEKSSGGLGQIESITSKIKEDPRLFLDAVENSIEYCPRESWATNLFATTKCSHQENETGVGKLHESFKEIRKSENITSVNSGLNNLIEALRHNGIDCRREQVTAVIMNLLRRGSTASTDTFTYVLNKFWHKCCLKIGLEIPVRTFAYLATSFPPSNRRILSFFRKEYGTEPIPSQLYSTIQQLLFDGCTDSCPDCLNNPNQFTDFGKPARNLSLSWLTLDIKKVTLTNHVNSWKQEVKDTLSQDGRVCIVVNNSSDLEMVSDHLQSIYFDELKTSNYSEAVHIQGVRRTGGNLLITLQIRGFIDGE
jgi:hypothetical protein